MVCRFGEGALTGDKGRFPQVSNITFTFDPRKPSGSRIVSVRVGDAGLDKDKPYTLCTRGYMVRGKGTSSNVCSGHPYRAMLTCGLHWCRRLQELTGQVGRRFCRGDYRRGERRSHIDNSTPVLHGTESHETMGSADGEPVGQGGHWSPLPSPASPATVLRQT
jgi:hypothetical protein